jgi:polar amino acid transport system substrate-binding protein
MRDMLVALLYVVYCFSCQAENIGLDEELTDCSLTVGWGIWAPYQYLSDTNQPKGAQIDLLNSIAAEAHCKLNYIQQPFSQNISGIKNGKIDLMADTTITSQRQRFAYFSDAYRHEILLLYVKKERVTSCKDKSLDDLLSNQFRIGLTQGNYYGEKVKAIQYNLKHSNNIVYMVENKDGMTALLNAEIDGFFEDPIVLAYELKRRNLLGQIKSCRIEIYAGEVSLMFSRKTVSREIVERFNKALEIVKQSAKYKSNWEW